MPGSFGCTVKLDLVAAGSMDDLEDAFPQEGCRLACAIESVFCAVPLDVFLPRVLCGGRVCTFVS